MSTALASPVRRGITDGRWQSAACGTVAVVAALVAQVASSQPRFSPDLLLDISSNRPIAGYVGQLDPGFTFSRPGEAYDGVYYWAMAVDPFLRGTAHTLVDMPGYRYGHPLWGWLGGLLSLGHASWLPQVFWLLTLASMGAAGWLASRLVQRLSSSPSAGWWGLVVAASPGLLFSASSDLTEPLQVALVCGALLLWQGTLADTGRHRIRCEVALAVVLAAACLTKEQLVLVPLALLIDAVARRVRRRAIPGWMALVALAPGPLLLGAWQLYLRHVLTPAERAYQDGNIGWPFSQVRQILDLASGLRGPDDVGAQVGGTVPSLLVGIGVVLALGVVAGLVRRDALGFVVVLQALVVSGLGWQTLLYPHETLRIPSVALALAALGIGAGRGRGERADQATPDR